LEFRCPHPTPPSPQRRACARSTARRLGPSRLRAPRRFPRGRRLSCRPRR
jgi:hypothetical protein